MAQEMEKEREFFETYETDKTDLIIDSIDHLLKLIPADDSYAVINLSFLSVDLY